MSRNSIAKNLKGPGLLSSRLTGQLEDSIFAAITSGSIIFNNVEITSGTVNGVVIGNDNPGPGFFTTIQSGNPTGEGYQVCFFGQTVGDSACWEPVIGRWNIQGDLLVRDISDLGNIRINSNSITSTNLNGNITIDPAGTGTINLVGPVNQTSITGNSSFSSLNFNVTSGNKNTIISTKNTEIKSTSRDVIVNPSIITDKIISFITSGVNPSVTTTISHLYEVGDTVDISSPGYSGSFKVSEILSSVSFKITDPIGNPTVQTSGTSSRQSNIFLNAYGNGNVKIPENIRLSFSDNNNVNIKSNGSNLYIDSDTLFVKGNLVVEGVSSTIESTITKIKDPVITLGKVTGPAVRDFKDRGVEFKYSNGVSEKTGFFGREDTSGCFVYIPDSINNNEVFTGQYGCAKFGAVTATSLNIQGGNITNLSSINACNIICANNLVLDSPRVTFTGQSQNFRETTEHLTNSQSPTNNISITFIDVTLGSAATGTLVSPGSNQDGFRKTIYCTLLSSGSSYLLQCPSGTLLDPGSGTTVSKTIKFDTPGQGVVLLWNGVKNFYVVLNGNACVF